MQVETFHKTIEKQLLEECRPGVLSSLLKSLKNVELNPLIVTAYDSISDPVLVVSISNCSIIYANPAATQLFQYSLKGHSLDGCIPGLGIVLKNSQAVREERMNGIRQDGVGVPLLVSVGRLAKEGINSKNNLENDVVVLTLNKITLKTNHALSRYKQEFEEIKVLGRGGFGIVLEARNRLDGQYYAIKKVRLNCSPENFSIFTNSSTPNTAAGKRHSRHLSASDHRLLNEVKTFALLSNHTNVIRYYNAWIETTEDVDQNCDESDTESDESVELDRLHQSTLYIQMQLCPYQDLRRWIRSRKDINLDSCMNIFYQITLGLAHIHSQGVIHRDVKPENIFVDQDHIFLGDFGLAKQIEESALSPSPRVSFLKPLVNSTDDGTFIYMAPENKTCQVSTTKSDIFSLGIILFELLTQFDTDMERAIMLNKLRSSRKIPQFLIDRFPAQSYLLSELISQAPEERPTAQEILASGIFVKNSRRVTVSSFGGSTSESPANELRLISTPENSAFESRSPLRETKSEFCLEAQHEEGYHEQHVCRSRRKTEDVVWMPWGPSQLDQVEEHYSLPPVGCHDKLSSSYNHGVPSRPKQENVSSSYYPQTGFSQMDPNHRILSLERDVACLEAKLKAMTAHYQLVESELEKSQVGSPNVLSATSIPLQDEDNASSFPIPIPFRK